MESPVTVIGEAIPVAIWLLPKYDAQVAVKLVMGLLPLDPGVNEIVNWALPGVATTLVGAPGGVGMGTTTVPDIPALFVGLFVAVAPPGAIDNVPSVGIDVKVSTATPAKFIVTLVVKTKLLGTIKSGGGTPERAAYPVVPISIFAPLAPLLTLAVNIYNLKTPPCILDISLPES